MRALLSPFSNRKEALVPLNEPISRSTKDMIKFPTQTGSFGGLLARFPLAVR